MFAAARRANEIAEQGRQFDENTVAEQKRVAKVEEDQRLANAEDQKAKDRGKQVADAAKKIHDSNMAAWEKDHPSAQMALAEENIPAIIRELVEEGFTSHDTVIAVRAGRKIHAIGGEMAIPIILGYTHDRRVVVSDWAKAWYKHYNPGALFDKIESDRKRTADVQSQPSPTPAAAAKLPSPPVAKAASPRP